MTVDSGRLIGFDIRPEPQTPDSLWDDERRSTFLLRDDVSRPLSVDQQVWASSLPEAAPNQWHGVLNHWSDLDALSGVARSLGLATQPLTCFIAVTIVWALLSNAERYDWATKRLDQTAPASLGPEWQVLGYDVADQWLTSGLSNCGYVGSERAEWRSRWANRINGAHLFDDPAEAGLFAKATNERVSEHAPFFVYGLFRRF